MEKKEEARRETRCFYAKHNGLRNTAALSIPGCSPVDVDNDNIADAVNFNMIGRTLLGWRQADNKAQQEVVAMLSGSPKPKNGKKSKAA